MNKEMKKISGRFLFVSVFIACVSAFFACGITVGERGEYNLNMTEYAVMSFSGSSQKLEAEFENNCLSVSFPVNLLKNKMEKFICLTPFSPVFYFFKGLKGLRW